MNMLHIINLFVIDKIFTEAAEISLSPMSKMLYINCLTHHFSDKPCSVSSAIAFEIFEDDIKGYDKYRRYFQELNKAKLVTIGIRVIVFNNVWGKYIDRSKLNSVSPEKYVAGFSFRPVNDFKEDLLKSTQLVELAQLKYKLSKVQIKKLVEIFIAEQITFDKKYTNLSDCIKHCTFWIGLNAQRVPAENVKSSGKILGKD
jgi:hypothetical protein